MTKNDTLQQNIKSIMKILYNGKIVSLTSCVANEADDNTKPRYGMSIKRYTPAIQKAIGCNVAAEPWMHIVWLHKLGSKQYDYLIYIWDTRVVLGEGKCTQEQYDKATTMSDYARDMRVPLKGSGKVVQLYNEIVSRLPRQFK